MIRTRDPQEVQRIVPPLTNLYGWWNASSAYTDSGKTTLCSSSGSDTCYTLADLSGNSRDLVQATAGNRPLWYSSQVNQLPALRFDGSNDELGTSSLSQAQPITFVMVIKPIALSGTNDILTFDTTGNGLRVQRVASNVKVYAGTSGTGSIDINLGAYYLLWGVANGASSEIQLNNNQIEVGGSGTATLTKIFLGSGDAQQWTNLDFCELLIYTGALTSASGDGLLVRQYLNNKFQLLLGI